MESNISMLFEGYSKLLDEKYDRYERIYKINRNVTTRSKKVIFMLQRLPGLNSEEKEKIFVDALKELELIEKSLIRNIAIELKNMEPLQYGGAYSGGIQEYIEAILFYHYLSEFKVMTFEEIQLRLCFADSDLSEGASYQLGISSKEYILGLSDFTGELMRFAIKSVSVGNLDIVEKICNLLQYFHVGFKSLPPHYSKELPHKINVFKSSLEKVENVCYSLKLLKCEFPSINVQDKIDFVL